MQLDKIITSPKVRELICHSFEDLCTVEDNKQERLDYDYNKPLWSLVLSYCLKQFETYLRTNNPEKLINKIFYETEESIKITNCARYFISFISDKVGYRQPDDTYFNHPEWPNLVSEIKGNYRLLQRNNKKYDFEECIKTYYTTTTDKWVEICAKKLGKKCPARLSETDEHDKKHCCKSMNYFLKEERVLLGYSKRGGYYYIVSELYDNIEVIDYCPWCGQKLAHVLGIK